MPVPSSLKKSSDEVMIIVKLQPRFNAPYIDEPDKSFNDPEFNALWKDLTLELPKFYLKRLFTRVPMVRIKDMVYNAVKNDPTYEPVDFSKYFYYKDETTKSINTLTILRKSSLFELIEVQLESSPPAVTYNDEAEYGNQGYLHVAPGGINAPAAWRVSGSTGRNVRIIDIEHGWHFDHDDLALPAGTLISGLNNSYQDHGCAVLGIIRAQDNGFGCIGISPDCELKTIGIYDNDGVYNPQNAIASAIDYFSTGGIMGDILLLEMQNADMYPIETIQPCREIIRTATALGIVVVEAAGNGNEDLNNYGRIHILDRTSSDFIDSGAIMVGGVNSTNRSRLDTAPASGGGSNFGNRVDCFSWYNNITTLGAPRTSYRNDFGGTSGASAIIAGATTALQGILKDRSMIYNSFQMRNWIGNPDLGTDSLDSGRDQVNVMPDMETLVADLLHPNDIYIRDNIDDVGNRYAGIISCSPDVITLPYTVVDPQTAYGEGSGTENNNALGNSIQAGQNNYIYVRVKNRGSRIRNNVQVTIFYSEVGTLITPDRWILIGSTSIPSVPRGNILTVTPNPIVWNSADIPASGHYCYVCLIGCAEDPMPDVAALSITGWAEFDELIRADNNITWRNFNVISPVYAARHMALHVPFNLNGAPNKKGKFQFHFIHTFPYGTRLQLYFPEDLLEQIVLTGNKINKTADGHSIEWIHLNVFKLMDIELPAGYTGPCRLKILLPDDVQYSKANFVSVTQFYKNKIVGKITWKINPEEKA